MKTAEKKWCAAGDKLRDLRKATGLSVFKAAKKIHVSGNYLSQLERGLFCPSEIVLHNIAEFYNTDEADLFALYNKIPSTNVEELLSNPSLRKVITQLSTDSRLSLEEKEMMSKQIVELVKNFSHEKGAKT